MKYTNKHIKEEYKLNQIGRTIGKILLVIGILLVGFGMIQTCLLYTSDAADE